MIKMLSSTYLKGIDKYIYHLYKYKDYCITVKKVININNPFILVEEEEEITLVDNNYYILEYMPFNDNYICRIHVDDKLNTIEKFYIVTINNHIEKGIPVFKDLKLSYVCTNRFRKKYNQDIIENILSEDEIKLAYKEIEKIEQEIKDNRNFIYNLDYQKYLV